MPSRGEAAAEELSWSLVGGILGLSAADCYSVRGMGLEVSKWAAGENWLRAPRDGALCFLQEGVVEMKSVLHEALMLF